MKSLKTILSVVQALTPAARAANATSAAVDLAGFEAATVEVNAGTVTDGSTTFKITESVDGVAYTDAPATSVLGSFPTLTSGGGNGSGTTTLVDYIGACRFIKVVATVAGATTGLLLGVNVIRGGARHNPAGATQVP